MNHKWLLPSPLVISAGLALIGAAIMVDPMRLASDGFGPHLAPAARWGGGSAFIAVALVFYSICSWLSRPPTDRGLRTNVTFRTDRFGELLGSPYDGQLGGDCAQWVIDELRSEELETESDAIQEDWGWIVLTRHGGCQFWIGVSAFSFPKIPTARWETEKRWLLHLHHADFSIQRFTKKGRDGLAILAEAVAELLVRSDHVTDIEWHYEHNAMTNQFDKPAERPMIDRGRK